MQTRAAAIESASHASKPFFDSQLARSTTFFSPSPFSISTKEQTEPGERTEVERQEYVIQAKLAMGAPGDRFEREEPVRRQARTGSTPDANAHAAESVQQGLAEQRGAGRLLDAPLRREMEHDFAADFSGVRIHTDASAAGLNDMVRARAFTHGQDVFFNAGEFEPHTSAGRHLLAHELTHVVQQSPSARSVPSVQRDGPKPGSPADKLETAKNELKAKFGLKDVSEQGGVAWTESQLKKIAGLFSKMSTEEQERLQGVTLVLTDKFPSKTLKGKTFNIAGTTYGTFRVELTPTGVSDTVLHEAGHLIHNNAIANAEKLFERSQIKADLETARNFLNASSKRRFSVPADQPQIGTQIQAVMDAAAAFERSGDDDRQANREALEEAEMFLPTIGSDPASQTLSAHVDKVRAFVAALLRWSDEREKAVGPVKRLDEFVGIVKKDRLARRSAIFTSYAEANWPDKPAEFFAEAYEAWRKNPAEVKDLSKDLVKWFERGGHLGPKIPPPRPPIKIPIPTKIPALHQHAPVLEELLLEAGQTFLPAIEDGVNIIDVLLPPPRVP